MRRRGHIQWEISLLCLWKFIPSQPHEKQKLRFLYCKMELLRPIPFRNTTSLVGQVIVPLNGKSFYKGLFQRQLNFLTLESHLRLVSLQCGFRVIHHSKSVTSRWLLFPCKMKKPKNECLNIHLLVMYHGMRLVGQVVILFVRGPLE